MSFIKPKKYLGQHFLTDSAIAKKITDSLQTNYRTVLEIGPGKGILTKHLLERSEFDTFVVEIDKECIDYLHDNFNLSSNNIINNDFLKLNLQEIFHEKFAIIGNFPYNISSQIFFKILDYKNLVTDVVCMLQKEVAKRICSPPGNRDYGILSVFLQAYFDINYLFTVKPGSFNPPPKVNSGVIQLIRNKNTALDCNEEIFFKIVKTSFNQRRKTLRNSLKGIIDKPPQDDIFSKRPEQLNYKEFINITNLISSFTK